jgi:coenzyme F420-reducing hydrogenase beta subunit
MKENKITERECYGCMLCTSKCPVGVISFTSDDCGFVYPTINSSKCIGCGVCEKVCIANNPPEEKRTCENTYSASLINKADLMRSASGGAAYGLGMAHLSLGGIVYGVAYTRDFHAAEYVRVSEVKDLSKLQDAKYFHATGESKNLLFSKVEQDLQNELRVLVIGLPCEIAALRKAFGDDKKLTLIDLFCHGVTTLLTHERYLNDRIGSGKISAFSVKAKIKGWQKNSYIRLVTADGKTIQEPFYSSEYGYAFAHLSRKSCYDCHFKGHQRVADISIGDCWGILQKGTDYNKDGVSVIMIHTNRGRELIEKCNRYLEITSIDPKEAFSDNAWVEKSIPLNDRAEYAKRFASVRNIYVPMQKKLRKAIKAIVGRQ